MKKRNCFIGILSAVMAIIMCFGFTACGKTETPPPPTVDVKVAGGYAYYPPDQGGYGLEMNLYEDGTYYFSQFTSSIHRGKYTAAEATGTDDDGRTRAYAVTFTENDIFTAPDATEPTAHYIVRDTDGNVYLTGIFDTMSNTSYDFKQQEKLIDEVVMTVASYWSVNYETDNITVAFYSNDTYALDGINGAGQAGSMGAFTVAESEGVTTYTMTDEKDSTKKYTLTVSGSSVILKAGETEYTMTPINPDASEVLAFEGTNAWGASVKLTLYNDTTCNLQITLTGMMDFSDATGTWSYQESEKQYIIILNGKSHAAAVSQDNENAFTFDYTINAAQFNGETVTLSYVKTAKTVLSLTGNLYDGYVTGNAVFTDDGKVMLTITVTGQEPSVLNGTFTENASGGYDVVWSDNSTAAVTSSEGQYTMNYELAQGGGTLVLTGSKTAA